jgi:hypothetical protein
LGKGHLETRCGIRANASWIGHILAEAYSALSSISIVPKTGLRGCLQF